jgi:hypothetical protein
MVACRPETGGGAGLRGTRVPPALKTSASGGMADPRGENPRVWAGHAGLEEKIALVGFPLRPAMSAEADLLSIVRAEFVAEKLAVRGTPRLHLAVHDRQRLTAKRTAGR